MPGVKIIDISGESGMLYKELNKFSGAGVGHLPEWQRIIKKAYNMESIYLSVINGSEIRGLLPLVFIKSRIFNNALVSMPYLNDGGILAQDRETELLLWSKAKAIMENENMAYLELRHTHEIDLGVKPRINKVGMILDLRGGKEEVWMKKLHQNVRNKIRKSEKMGVKIKKGPEWLEGFYEMHVINMKELGSPAHSLRFFSEMLNVFKDRIGIYVAVLDNRVIGGKIVCYFKDTLYFLWVSSPLKYHKYAPVNLMNWQAIKDSIENGFRYCNFGRSTVNSSHYNFKKKWGATPLQLFWHVYPDTQDDSKSGAHESKKYKFLSSLWKRLPLSAVKFIGPKLRSGFPQ